MLRIFLNVSSLLQRYVMDSGPAASTNWPTSDQNPVFASATRVNGHVGVASLCFLAWDILIHLGDEVEYIWQGGNTWLKYMYLLIRYIPVLTQGCLLIITTGYSSGIRFPLYTCRGWVLYQGLASEFMSLAVETVLLVRVYALYNRSKFILWTLSTLFLAEIAATLTVIILTTPKIEFNRECIVTFAPRIYGGYWLSSLGFETILFLLTIFKFATVVRRGLGDNTVINVIVRDGTWAYAMVFAILLLNLSMYRFDHTAMAGIFYFWHLTVMSFAGSHLLLNLRRLSTRVRLTHTLSAHFTSGFDVGYQLSSFGQKGHFDASASEISGMADRESIPVPSPLSRTSSMQVIPGPHSFDP
ncbi:hypothetical protein SERLA73DRAFT_175071 [Serpula lacrymans var. lacrymans S7.3]|uniref:DUF6533 domain-containing protein n=2 Tax=Serpula lacrymans var. lacrymans TaxID=341189 RepID=F8PKL7_SERL3|nr:uncharacterized protein SERLADRAFT_457035 [Serpula lacrymans var. lacrymans S7.9]EGO03564.1 hypothetical protein SERLA73DRAFT_175071 [Serpula lacrymans var. lacrymans S7.3]EGO29384.1 hypothetical protein SERLADRAFT_457035 [Serpula lacrymans var. lacrymans S7.9]